VDSAPGKGTRFEVYFPAVQESEEQPAEEADRHLRSGHSEVVLLVEDEDQVRDLAAEFIESAGYAVLTARDGQDALRVAEQSGKRIRVLVTDIVMPNMRGPELAKRLNQRCDGLRVIYMSGYLEFNNGSDFLKDMFFLQKPFSRDSLVAKIADALGKEREHNSHPLALVNS